MKTVKIINGTVVAIDKRTITLRQPDKQAPTKYSLKKTLLHKKALVSVNKDAGNTDNGHLEIGDEIYIIIFPKKIEQIHVDKSLFKDAVPPPNAKDDGEQYIFELNRE